jgi:hypothetical protein
MESAIFEVSTMTKWPSFEIHDPDTDEGNAWIVAKGEFETLHLLRSPANARRLSAAIADIAGGRTIAREL